MKNIYKIEAGEVTKITITEAVEAQNVDGYGIDFITAFCETAEEALALADAYDAGKIGYDNISGQEAIEYGLVGLESK